MQLPIGQEENFAGVVDLLQNKAVRFEGDKGEKVVVSDDIPEDMKADVAKYRAELIEAIVANDDAMMTAYLDGKEPTLAELKKVLRKAVIKNDLFPVFTGTALKNKGVQLVLDAVVDYLPSPKDMPPMHAINPDTDEEVVITANDNEPLSALAFKVASDPFVGQLIFFRVYSGTLTAGSYIYNPRTRNKERVGRIVRMHANEREEVKKVFAGEIAAAVGLKETITSDTLCEAEHPIALDRIVFPEPVISMRIEPKTKADQEKMGMALSRLAQEDPTFRVTTDQETGETIIAGMGELHLEIIVDRMKREFTVEVNVGKPQVAYRETISAESEAEGKYIKQTGGRGNYGHVRIKMKPMQHLTAEEIEDLPRNTKHEAHFEFINTIKGGAIPLEYIPACEKGFREGLDRGVVAGFKMVDISVELWDGSYHDVDSNEMAFKIAASMAVQEAAKRARPVLLEPMMNVEVVTPDKFMGDVTGSLSGKRGIIEGMEQRGLNQAVKAVVPLSEMFGYMTTLRSMTEGRAGFTMEFLRYDIVPSNVAAEIVKTRTAA